MKRCVSRLLLWVEFQQFEERESKKETKGSEIRMSMTMKCVWSRKELFYDQWENLENESNCVDLPCCWHGFIHSVLHACAHSIFDRVLYCHRCTCHVSVVMSNQLISKNEEKCFSKTMGKKLLAFSLSYDIDLE